MANISIEALKQLRDLDVAGVEFFEDGSLKVVNFFPPVQIFTPGKADAPVPGEESRAPGHQESAIELALNPPRDE